MEYHKPLSAIFNLAHFKLNKSWTIYPMVICVLFCIFFLLLHWGFLICWVDNLDISPKRIRGLRRNMNSKNNNPSVAWCLKTNLELIHTTENRQTYTNLLNPNVDLKYMRTRMHTHKLNSNFFWMMLTRLNRNWLRFFFFILWSKKWQHKFFFSNELIFNLVQIPTLFFFYNNLCVWTLTLGTNELTAM